MISDAQYRDWLSDDNNRMVLVRSDVLTNPLDADSLSTVYIANRRWYDEVNGNLYIGRLRDDLQIREYLSISGEGGDSGVGAIGIDNQDGELDGWMYYGWAGQSLDVRLGDPAWPFSDYRLLFSGTAEALVAPNDDLLELTARDLYESLKRPIVERPLNTHRSAFLEPLPLSLGGPANVSPPRGYSAQAGTYYALNAWDLVSFGSVKENGKTTTKSTATYPGVGGDDQGIGLDVTEPDGSVTVDGPIADTGSGTIATWLYNIMRAVFSWDSAMEFGIARSDGDAVTLYLDENASTVDGYYVGSGATLSDVGFVRVHRRTVDSVEQSNVSAYDGFNRTVTLGTALSFNTESGDVYEIVPPSPVRMGPLDPADIDFDFYSPHNPYFNIAVWDRGGELTYLDFLNNAIPAGAWHYISADGKLHYGLLQDMFGIHSGESDLVLDSKDLMGEVSISTDGDPVYRVRLGYAKNWTVTNNPDDTLAPDEVAALRQEYRWEMSQSLPTKQTWPQAREMLLHSWYTENSTAQREAERIRLLYAPQRYRGVFTARMKALSVPLHSAIEIHDHRYNLDEAWRLLGRTIWPLQDRVEMELWR